MADVWTNMFDLGECTVSVVNSGTNAVMFSQVMEKGDTANFSDGDANQYSVSVSAEGHVSLEGDSWNDHGFEVRVTPSYPHNYPCRITAAAFGEGVVEAKGVINAVGGDFGVDYTSIDPAAPEPCVLTDAGGSRDFIGLRAIPSLG